MRKDVGILFVTCLLMFCSCEKKETQEEEQGIDTAPMILYTDFEPNLTSPDPIRLDLDNDGVLDFSLSYELEYVESNGSGTTSVYNQYVRVNRLRDSLGVSFGNWIGPPPWIFDCYGESEIIDSTSTWNTYNVLLGSMWGVGQVGAWNHAPHQHYIGLRILNSDGEYTYGWIRLAGEQRIVDAMAWNGNPNSVIHTGQTE